MENSDLTTTITAMIPTIISIIISVISLMLSFFVLAKDWWYERLRINVSLVKWFASMANEEPFFLWLTIENNSKLPFSITKMELEGNRSGMELNAISQGSSRLVASIKSNIKEQNRDILSKEYPIVVNGYEGVGGYFHFTANINAYNFEGQTFTLTVFTNRGKRQIKNIDLRFGDNIMRAMQNKEGSIPFTNDAQGNPIIYTSEEL